MGGRDPDGGLVLPVLFGGRLEEECPPDGVHILFIGISFDDGDHADPGKNPGGVSAIDLFHHGEPGGGAAAGVDDAPERTDSNH